MQKVKEKIGQENPLTILQKRECTMFSLRGNQETIDDAGGGECLSFPSPKLP